MVSEKKEPTEFYFFVKKMSELLELDCVYNVTYKCLGQMNAVSLKVE